MPTPRSRARPGARSPLAAGGWPRRWGAFVLGLLALAIVGRPDVARARIDPKGAKEYEVKAAFLYNFLVYTSWPEGTFEEKDTPIRFLIVGEDPFGEIIDDTFKGKRIGERAVEISRATKLPAKVRAHVVYRADDERKELKKTIEALAEEPVLLIGESPGFAASGAIINFFLDEKNVKFEINPGAAEKAGISLSSQLLKLAKIVETEEEEEEKRR